MSYSTECVTPDVLAHHAAAALRGRKEPRADPGTIAHTRVRDDRAAQGRGVVVGASAPNTGRQPHPERHDRQHAARLSGKNGANWT